MLSGRQGRSISNGHKYNGRKKKKQSGYKGVSGWSQLLVYIEPLRKALLTGTADRKVRK